MPETGTEQQLSDLSKDYNLRVMRALRRIIRAIDLYSHKLGKDHSITSPQLLCLTQIVTDSSTTLSDLCKQVHMSPSTVCGILDRLRAKGLVMGERTDRDRRKVVIVATEEGRTLVTNAPSLLQDNFAESFSGLPIGEQMMITGALERIVQMMEIEHIDSAPLLAVESQPDQDEQGNT